VPERIRLAATPPRPALEQLRPCRAEDKERHAGGAVDELIDEVEQTVVGPMEVFEDQNEGPLLGQRLEEPAPRRERLREGAGRMFLVTEADEGREVSCDPAPLGGVGCHHVDRALELLLSLSRPIAFENACLRLHHLAEGPEGEALAVGKGTPLAPGDEVGLLLEHAHELVDEPRLADAGNADERDELYGRLRASPRERVPQDIELASAPDERDSCDVRNVDAYAGTRL
jgi:hypothetical protein